MRFNIVSFGCKVNQYESGAIAASMRDSGFEQTDEAKSSDVIIVNSCTVTGRSDEKAEKLIKSLKIRYPEKILALIGCFAQAFPEKADKLPADIIIGSHGKDRLPLLIFEFLANRGQKKEILDLPDIFEELPFQGGKGNTRAYLKIEDGCDRCCSYCIIPAARGRVRSRSLSSIIEETKKLADLKHREIVLTGINLSRYGSDIGLSLCDAAEAVSQIKGISRVRLSSLEPQLIDNNLIERLSYNLKFCPHFHLSLQSGCSETLKRMNRGYTAEEYNQIVENIRNNFENVGLTTDIMVGFPGETEEEFRQSLEFAEKIRFSKIHVFTYSQREGTPAAELPQINAEIKRRRYNQMSKLAMMLREKFMESRIGFSDEIIVEKRTSPEFIMGHTKNYTPVRIYGGDAQRGKKLKIRIIGAGEGHCIGKTI
ncbi:MAG: tRNA (N(6)-L-threonylcarbamoyladenosine(37)-C(2))-methylthiotransferase MtaB [Eubacterium sp.]|jgi:threonylcarbamoyladenosine tRNA methylthiotransferase MtaB|nr:tRNA (N(6)-L-threonylcarbamoyladenosine(37)-C(2))-methylthiotransferase MtaB [Eubacterium sp.]